jgi:hypothetical protein
MRSIAPQARPPELTSASGTPSVDNDTHQPIDAAPLRGLGQRSAQYLDRRFVATLTSTPDAQARTAAGPVLRLYSRNVGLMKL